jgi:hypothetical protein
LVAGSGRRGADRRRVSDASHLADLVGSQATFTSTALALGSHTITALYSGDFTFSGSQGDNSASPQVVNKGATTTLLVASPNPTVSGQPAVFTAIVLVAAPAAGGPTGSVTFMDGAATLATNVSVSGGRASFSTTSLAVGTHTITASYSGDSDFLASNASATQIVGKAQTKTMLTSSPSTSVFGQGVVFTATVNPVPPGGGSPTGTVDFKEGATDLTPGGVTASGGRATFSSSRLAVGSHTLTASYGGSAGFLPSSGSNSASPQVVNKAASRTVLTAFPDPAVFGQVISFMVRVTALAPGNGTPTGTLKFLDGTTTIGSLSLSSASAGRATFTTASLTRGSHAISVNYSGDNNFLASSYANFGEGVQDHDERESKCQPGGGAPGGDLHGDGASQCAGERDAHRYGYLQGHYHRARHGHPDWFWASDLQHVRPGSGHPCHHGELRWRQQLYEQLLAQYRRGYQEFRKSAGRRCKHPSGHGAAQRGISAGRGSAVPAKTADLHCTNTRPRPREGR